LFSLTLDGLPSFGSMAGPDSFLDDICREWHNAGKLLPCPREFSLSLLSTRTIEEFLAAFLPSAGQSRVFSLLQSVVGWSLIPSVVRRGRHHGPAFLLSILLGPLSLQWLWSLQALFIFPRLFSRFSLGPHERLPLGNSLPPFFRVRFRRPVLLLSKLFFFVCGRPYLLCGPW